jgi:peptidoglycan/xylan/chitin deacetylase (PgdA/CDA1 family)
VNAAFKHFGERVLVGSGAARFARSRLRGRTLVLAYHDVVPDGDVVSGNVNLHLPQREFSRQLDILVRTHDVVPIDMLLTHPSSSGRPRAIITFDDAYAGALTAGVQELVRRGLPATIFVAPALLGSTPWWDILAQRTSGVVPDRLQRYALEALGGHGGKILRWAQPETIEPTAATTLPRIGTETQLKTAASRSGITLGSHSWSHPNLCALTSTELEVELTKPLRWLQSRFTTVAPWLSYPYGYFGDSVQNVAAKVGYVGSLRVDGGWVPASAPPPHAIPRLNIPNGLSLNGFRLRLAGFF